MSAEPHRLPDAGLRAQLGAWAATSARGRILASACVCAPQQPCRLCQAVQQDLQIREAEKKAMSIDGKRQAPPTVSTTVYNEVLNFPHLPDMVFPDNILTLDYAGKGKIEFTALEAMKCIDIKREPIQVACAETWQENRSDFQQKGKSFDWTFSTDYKGTFSDGLELTPTTEKIDMELLKKRDKILFYEDIPLFEDELHDQGIASCSVKIRIMPSCWYILLRYFLRVDNVLSRINDTRMFYLLDSPHILTEYTSRESTLPELKLPLHIVTDPNELAQHLPIQNQITSKIILPTSS